MNQLRCLRAIDRRDLDLIQRLLSTGQDFNSGIGERKMPPVIYYAVQKNFTEAVDLLIKAGCNVNVKYSPELKTPLYVSAFIGNKAITKLLCESGANVNETTVKGETAMFAAIEWASLSENLTIIKTLISFGADINAMTTTGLTPLLKSIQVECLPAVKVLIENGSKLDLNYYEELKCSLKCNNNSVVKYLLHKYAEQKNLLNCQSSVSPVDLCLQYHNLIAMKTAIELGFKANDRLFENPLIILKTIQPNWHKDFNDIKYCFDYLLTYNRLIDFDLIFAFKQELAVTTKILNGNLLSYALIFNCSHMSYKLIEIGSHIDNSILNYYRFHYNDLESLKLLFFCGMHFPAMFETKCLPSITDPIDRTLNKNEFKGFCNWIKTMQSNPYKLMDLIRIQLRNTYGNKLSEILHKINLPNKIVNYLLFID